MNMTRSPNLNDRLLELAEKACNGALDAEDYIQLDSLLLSSPINQRTYLEYLSLHADLAEVAIGAEQQLERVLTPARAPVSHRRLLVRRVALCLIPVACVVAAIIWRPSRSHDGLAARPPAQPQRPAWIATVRAVSQDAAWKVHDQVSGAQAFSDQAIAVLRGCIELTFQNGTRVLAEGPSRLVVNNDLSVSLAAGSVRTTLPNGASGFQVLTDSMEVIDRGTQFYLDLAADGRTTFYVGQGLCDVRGRAPAQQSEAYLPVAVGEGVLVDQQRELVALNAEQSRHFSEHIVSRFLAYDLNLHDISPSVCLVRPLPGLVDASLSSANRPVYLIPERLNHRLVEDLVVPGPDGKTDITLRAGTSVDSFILHNAFGPALPAGSAGQSRNAIRTSGHIVFNQPVLAVLRTQAPLRLTDRQFAPEGLRYPNEARRALEDSDRVLAPSLSPNRIDFDLHSTEGDLDQVRVITRSEANIGLGENAQAVNASEAALRFDGAVPRK